MLKISPTEDRKHLVRLLADVVSIVEPRLLELWTTTGLTFGQRRLLRRLREGPRSAGALASELGVAAPSLTRQLQKLEDKGLIVRTMDPEDRRRVVVTLTPAGDKVLAGHKVFGGSPIALAVQDLTAKQQHDLARNLEALIHLARRHAGRAADE
ncbi:MAG TPA: MarR family transcriptional regulator [Candidatus Udaeobacter sp.]|nr:MarR family transcriptional regulator [Candidatus Udaeobacter sp.]